MGLAGVRSATLVLLLASSAVLSLVAEDNAALKDRSDDLRRTGVVACSGCAGTVATEETAGAVEGAGVSNVATGAMVDICSEERGASSSLPKSKVRA